MAEPLQSPPHGDTAARPLQPRNTLAVSTVIFALRPDPGSGLSSLWLPLVRRTRAPFRDQWALPGGWLSAVEEPDVAAARTLFETTALTPTYLEQLYTFGALGRSPGDRVVSIVYWALVQSDEAARSTVGDNVRWFTADRLPELAFDHNRIVAYALWRLRTKMEYSRIAHSFLGETFTLAQLREVHEAVLLKALDPANFRRSMESSGTLIDTGRRVSGTRHRPPRLFRYDDSGGSLEPAFAATSTSTDTAAPHPADPSETP